MITIKQFLCWIAAVSESEMHVEMNTEDWNFWNSRRELDGSESKWSVKIPKSIRFYDVQAKELSHLAISLGIFLVLDKRLKNIFLAYAISFPSALFGMFFLFLLLTTISAINTGTAISLFCYNAVRMSIV